MFNSQTHANRYTRLECAKARSIGVLVLRHQNQRGLEKNVEVEQNRPVLDVVEVELHALLDFFLVVDFAAPAVDAGFDTVAREIAVDGLVEQPALQLALHRMRAGPDQRKIALEHDVEQLRQLIKAGLANE